MRHHSIQEADRYIRDRVDVSGNALLELKIAHDDMLTCVSRYVAAQMQVRGESMENAIYAAALAINKWAAHELAAEVEGE